MYSLPTSWTLAALTIASAASTAPTKPFVSTMPRASILIVFSESEFLSLMKPNHKLAVESAQAVHESATWERDLGAQASLPACFGQSVLAGSPQAWMPALPGRAPRAPFHGQLVLIQRPVYDSASSAIKIQIRRKQ